MPVPVNVTPPIASGEPVVGAVLTCEPGEWTGEDKPRTYQWCFGIAMLLIDGATELTYTVTESDRGRDLACAEYAANVASGVGFAKTNYIGPIGDELEPPPSVWITPEDVAAYHDWPGAPSQRLIDATAAVRAAVERRRSDLDFADPVLVAADVRLGSIRWAGLIYQARGAPSGFTGYDEQSTLYDALGAQRAEIMRLIGWRRPVAI